MENLFEGLNIASANKRNKPIVNIMVSGTHYLEGFVLF